VSPDRPSGWIAPALAAAGCALLLACTAPPAGAAPALGWSTAKIDGERLTGISCASDSLCVAVDAAGEAFTSIDPAAGAAARWSRAKIDGTALTGISCASAALCAAVDASGNALVTTNPAAGAAGWSTHKIDGPALTGISCASASLCVAVDGKGDALVATDPAAGAGAVWRPREIDGTTELTGISCASASLCVAVDGKGNAVASTEPATGTWRKRSIDSVGLTSVSCSPAPAGVCVAVDGEGNAAASGNATAEAPTWSSTPAFPLAPVATGVSCTSAGLCVAVDREGGAFASDDPAAAAPAWSYAGIDAGRQVTGVSCVPEGLCAAVDAAGNALIATVPAPAVAGGPATAVTETSAVLTGTVNPEDATLSECRFEYGPTENYGRLAPCAAPLPTGGAAQGVSAAVEGLAANTAWHWRLAAVNASGEAVSVDGTFKTAAPPLPQPHPSIGGVPALGQQLTCKSGVGGSGAALSYGWLRDTRTIGGANGSAYVVTAADVSRHLQCRVTATNAAGSVTATSSFVTVPAGGLGSISETRVGTPRVSGGAVSVPVKCSAQAAGSCAITVRLTVVETLHGRRVTAVSAARGRHATVTVGAATAHLRPGEQTTLTVALNRTGRRLLARLKRMTVRLSVTGTVVGALRGPLESAAVTFGRAGRAASRRAARGASARRGR
jgi:hypothetical protein